MKLIRRAIALCQRPPVRNKILLALVAASLIAIGELGSQHFRSPIPYTPSDDPYPPLAMAGGDPYIRALMRTIAAAEADLPQPYFVLYGGLYVSNLDRHPDRCVPIVAGPNIGDCTTAAGRYQMLTSTWYEKARAYHPDAEGWWQTSYSFEPHYQDTVVYRWLSDRRAWGRDIGQLLRQDRLDEVLRMLSGTWTSLGYGIEDNAITPYLSEIYDRLLAEELAA